MTEFVNAYGQPLDISRLPRAQKRVAHVKPATGVEHEDFMSLGFVVEGFTQEMLDSARKYREWEIETYDERLAEALEDHKPAPRRPQPWDEEQWFLSAKPAKVRSRPYEIRSAADECVALATKTGWLCVRVTEVRRARNR
jgi:hypothetical protein